MHTKIGFSKKRSHATRLSYGRSDMHGVPQGQRRKGLRRQVLHTYIITLFFQKSTEIVPNFVGFGRLFSGFGIIRKNFVLNLDKPPFFGKIDIG